MKWQMPIVLRAIVALTILKPATATINSTFVIGIIERLYDVYPIKTVPIFWSPLVETTDNLLESLSQQLSQKYSIPQLQFTESSKKELRYILDANTTLSIIVTDHMSREILKMVSARLQGMHLSRLLFVLREPLVLDQLRYLQTWLWTKQFLNTLVLYEDNVSKQNQIFTLNVYPHLHWINKTNELDPSRLFMADSKDMKQYVIEVYYMEDVPRVFILKKKNGQKKVVGRHANIVQLFAKYMNIKIIYHLQVNSDEEKILREFRNENRELSVNSYSMFDLEKIGRSYPLETVRWCVMVPLRSEVPKSDYVIISFDRATWIATGLSVIYIAMLLRFIDPPSSQTSQKYFFLRSLTILMYSPNMAARMTMPTIRQFLFFAQVFLLGFILSCIYSTYLTSFCTNMVLQPPIDSVEDLVKENLRVMVIDYELEEIRTRASYSYGETFLKLLYPVSYYEVNHRRVGFDDQYAYTVRQDRWNFINKQQRGLEKVFFRLSNICFGSHFTMFPLQIDSHLRPHMDMFIQVIMQSGLNLFWDEEAFSMAVSMKLSKVLVEQSVKVQPLELDYFKHVFAGYWSLIAISTLTFAVEYLHEKFFFIRRALERAKMLEEYVHQKNNKSKGNIINKKRRFIH